MRWRRPRDQEPTPAPAEGRTADAPDLWALDDLAPTVRADLPPAYEPVLDPSEVARALRRAVARALAEDLAEDGDVTSAAVVPATRTGAAVIVSRADGVVAGVDAIREVYGQLDPRVEVTYHVADGEAVTAGQVLAELSGPLRSILAGERVALNFLGHLSGVATLTRRCVEALAGTGTVVRDTRKTTPGLRLLEKAAVRAGGGHNHRLHLADALLVKDTHVAVAGGVAAATRAALEGAGGRPVQVEVRDLNELEEALAAGATDILLDNFSVEQVRRAVRLVAGRARLEASGGITLEQLRAYAEAGVDRIALGALTHSAPWLDVALEIRSAAHTTPEGVDLWQAEPSIWEPADGATAETEPVHAPTSAEAALPPQIRHRPLEPAQVGPLSEAPAGVAPGAPADVPPSEGAVPAEVATPEAPSDQVTVPEGAGPAEATTARSAEAAVPEGTGPAETTAPPTPEAPSPPAEAPSPPAAADGTTPTVEESVSGAEPPPVPDAAEEDTAREATGPPVDSLFAWRDRRRT